MSPFAPWRRRKGGPERTIAKGLVVFGNPGFQDSKQLNELLIDHDASVFVQHQDVSFDRLIDTINRLWFNALKLPVDQEIA